MNLPFILAHFVIVCTPTRELKAPTQTYWYLLSTIPFPDPSFIISTKPRSCAHVDTRAGRMYVQYNQHRVPPKTKHPVVESTQKHFPFPICQHTKRPTYARETVCLTGIKRMHVPCADTSSHGPRDKTSQMSASNRPH